MKRRPDGTTYRQPINLPPDLVAQIDDLNAQADQLPRMTFVRHLIELGAARFERSLQTKRGMAKRSAA